MSKDTAYEFSNFSNASIKDLKNAIKELKKTRDNSEAYELSLAYLKRLLAGKRTLAIGKRVVLIGGIIAVAAATITSFCGCNSNSTNSEGDNEGVTSTAYRPLTIDTKEIASCFKGLPESAEKVAISDSADTADGNKYNLVTDYEFAAAITALNDNKSYENVETINLILERLNDTIPYATCTINDQNYFYKMVTLNGHTFCQRADSIKGIEEPIRCDIDYSGDRAGCLSPLEDNFILDVSFKGNTNQDENGALYLTGNTPIIVTYIDSYGKINTVTLKPDAAKAVQIGTGDTNGRPAFFDDIEIAARTFGFMDAILGDPNKITDDFFKIESRAAVEGTPVEGTAVEGTPVEGEGTAKKTPLGPTNN